MSTKPVKEPVKTPVKKKKKYYLNNKDMLREWKLSNDQAEMTDIFSDMMKVLTTRYSGMVRFNVCDTFRDDMEAYALANVAKVWRSFNPEKSSNPFAYFTQCVKRAFFQYQNMERKQRDIGNALNIEMGNDPTHAYMVEYEFEKKDMDKIGGEVTTTYGTDYSKEQHEVDIEKFKAMPRYGRKTTS
jgi:hypothetical protein